MNKNNSTIFALTILISGVVIGGGILISRTNFLNNIFSSQEQQIQIENGIEPISEDDHILGSPNADVIVVEYSDFECPFCLEFHETMNRIIDEYGSDGRVAWVYRHMPLEEIHLQARRLALTSECIAELGGNNKFWEFSNAIFDNTPDSLLKNTTDQIINDLGFDVGEIDSCTQREDIIMKLEADIADGSYLMSIDQEFGTPYNIVITKTGLVENVSGTIPYSILRDLIEQHSLTF